MLTSATRDQSARVGLALAGGGPEGAIYEIGVLRALDEALDGVDFNELPVYVGVSAGAFLTANLANHISTAQNVRAIVKHEPGEHPFVPQTFFTPAVGELVRRSLMTPSLLVEAIWDYIRHPTDQTVLESMMRLTRALPVGLFDNEPIRQYLSTIYSIRGRTDDFRALDRKLVVVATELDSGQAVRFGDPGWDHVPISLAVQASTALPGLYPPVVIEGRHYVDGVLLKTMHASVALEAGAELVICINPIVPVDTLNAAHGVERRRLTTYGLPTVMSQTFRTLIHSRMRVGLAAYAPRFPNQDIVLLEPQPDDYRMFFTNIFSFSSRKAVCEYAYRATRRDLLKRYAELGPVFARHGVRLRLDVLEDPTRDLWAGVGLDGGPRGDEIRGELGVADQLDRALADLERYMARQEA
ncbi:MAG: patatin-like phospholipase family protein [Acidobacteria bacterium]|nr:patatin-like phospholipase family protein [Acidobacteriota bacterium]